MYKIYINEQCLTLLPAKKVKNLMPKVENSLFVRYFGKKKFLLNYVDMLEKGSKYNSVHIYADDYKGLKRDFKSLYEDVPAGGGLVLNEKDQILFIFRRGFWDLPKGKMEGKESIKECAVREVMEETGVGELELVKKICTTNHQFKRNGIRKIKKSYWYLMRTKSVKLIPQTEEDITKAKWMSLEKFMSKERPVYKSIMDVLKKYEKIQEKELVNT